MPTNPTPLDAATLRAVIDAALAQPSLAEAMTAAIRTWLDAAPRPVAEPCQHMLTKEAQRCRHGLYFGTTCRDCILSCPQCWDHYTSSASYGPRPVAEPPTWLCAECRGQWLAAQVAPRPVAVDVTREWCEQAALSEVGDCTTGQPTPPAEAREWQPRTAGERLSYEQGHKDATRAGLDRAIACVEEGVAGLSVARALVAAEPSDVTGALGAFDYCIRSMRDVLAALRAAREGR